MDPRKIKRKADGEADPTETPPQKKVKIAGCDVEVDMDMDMDWDEEGAHTWESKMDWDLDLATFDQSYDKLYSELPESNFFKNFDDDFNDYDLD